MRVTRLEFCAEEDVPYQPLLVSEYKSDGMGRKFSFSDNDDMLKMDGQTEFS